MSIVARRESHASEEQVVAEMTREGYVAAPKDYLPGKTEPHRHDFDVCLHIVEGEFKLAEVDTSTVHRFVPGDRVFVRRGTLHAEDHGQLRMVVGRRA